MAKTSYKQLSQRESIEKPSVRSLRKIKGTYGLKDCLKTQINTVSGFGGTFSQLQSQTTVKQQSVYREWVKQFIL